FIVSAILSPARVLANALHTSTSSAVGEPGNTGARRPPLEGREATKADRVSDSSGFFHPTKTSTATTAVTLARAPPIVFTFTRSHSDMLRLVSRCVGPTADTGLRSRLRARGFDPAHQRPQLGRTDRLFDEPDGMEPFRLSHEFRPPLGGHEDDDGA